MSSFPAPDSVPPFQLTSTRLLLAEKTSLNRDNDVPIEQVQASFASIEMSGCRTDSIFSAMKKRFRVYALCLSTSQRRAQLLVPHIFYISRSQLVAVMFQIDVPSRVHRMAYMAYID